jgi:phenylpyruvate tautomerase PptA (4-oxalocrotonate tautomerase family)
MPLMPFVTVDHAPGISDGQRLDLQQRLARVVMETFDAPPGNVRVFTRAIDPATIYMGDGRTDLALPIIRVEFITGRNVHQKRALVKGLAEVAADVLQIPVDQVRTVLFDQPLTEWARGARLMADQ